MLDNDIASIRLGGIYTRYKIVCEHPDEYLAEVSRLLDAYKGNPYLGLCHDRHPVWQSYREDDDGDMPVPGPGIRDQRPGIPTRYARPDNVHATHLCGQGVRHRRQGDLTAAGQAPQEEGAAEPARRPWLASPISYGNFICLHTVFMQRADSLYSSGSTPVMIKFCRPCCHSKVVV